MDLKNCAAAKTTEGDSSTLVETTEPMEESSAVATASLKKRKAESDPAEESGDENEDSGDDEYVDSDDELINPTWWTVLEWDVDSFEGLEYHSSQEENELSDEEAEKKWRRYKRLVIESKGFYVEPGLRPMYCFSGIKPVGYLELPAGFGQTYREYFAEMACLCLQKYNQDKCSHVEFVEVVRGNYTTGSRSKSYITFMAKRNLMDLLSSIKLRCGVHLFSTRTIPSFVNQLLRQSLQINTK